MTRKGECNWKSNSFVTAAEQVCLQSVLEHRQRRGRGNFAWQAIPHLCSSKDWLRLDWLQRNYRTLRVQSVLWALPLEYTCSELEFSLVHVLWTDLGVRSKAGKKQCYYRTEPENKQKKIKSYFSAKIIRNQFYQTTLGNFPHTFVPC